MVLTLALLVSLIAQDAQASATVDAIVARYVQAIGGRDQLLTHESVRRTIKVTLLDGTTAQVIQEHQRPNKFRAELATLGGATIFYAFDGEQGWSLSPLTTAVVKVAAEEAAQLAHEADMDGPLVDYQIKGHQLTLVGREDLDGRAVDHLRLVRRGALPGEDEHHYLAADTALPVKVIVNQHVAGMAMRRELSFADYRSVDGILIAHHVREKQVAGSESVTEQVLEAVTFGGNLAPEHFRLADAANPARARIPPLSIANDQGARATYGAMIAALRHATKLSFESRYSADMGGLAQIDCTYKIWLKKPNQYRMEAFNRMESLKADGTASGVLVGDGSVAWIFWPHGRPVISANEDPAEPRTNTYMTKPAPAGHHSIGHDAALLGAGMAMTILDPSTFHGYTDSLQPLIDAVGGARTETVDGEPCDVVQVSFMDGQRSWELWISRRDHLPRKLREIVRVHVDLIAEETWTKIVVDGEIADERFQWAPPDDWQEYRRPESESHLLAAGTPAKDFELELAQGGTQRLADLRGKVVMLVFWRAG